MINDFYIFYRYNCNESLVSKIHKEIFTTNNKSINNPIKEVYKNVQYTFQ